MPCRDLNFLESEGLLTIIALLSLTTFNPSLIKTFKEPLGPDTLTLSVEISRLTLSGISIILFPILDINYHTLHRISPPTPMRLATLFEITPFEVDRTEMPKPSNTRGISFWLT